jgi:hypothetical protein
MKLRTIFVLCALATTAVYSTAYAAPDDDDPCVRADRTGSTKDAQECIDGQESEASKQRRRDQEQQRKNQQAEAARRATHQAAQAQAIEEQRQADERNGFRRISVSDLELDKETIKGGVITTGFVLQDGGIEWLVEYPSTPGTPKVGIMSAEAPREVRQALQRCRLSGICRLTLMGYMTSCEMTIMGKVVKNDRCLSPTGLR